MNNRLHNSTNHFQGTAKRVLCVCSAGLLRSPTAAVVLQREFGYNTRAVGIDVNYALIPVDNVMVHWADEIVVMNSWMAGIIQDFKESNGKHIICLDIPDEYAYMDENLQKLVIESYKEKTSNEI